MCTKKWIVVVICIFLIGSLFLSPQGSTLASTTANDQPPPPSPSQGGSSSSDKKFDKKDIPRAIRYMNTHEKRNLAPVQVKGRPLPPVNPNYVQPIIFLANDLSESPGNRSSVDATFQMLERWYSGALEQNYSGYTFRAIDTIVFEAPQPFSYYKCPNHETSCDNFDGIWSNVQIELLNAGYPLWSDGTIYIVFVKGAGGWAGANNSNTYTNWPAPGPASKGGFGILGDWALDAITGTTNDECFVSIGTACYRDPQRGAVGHELGHAFGLAHALDQYGSIMWSWWDFPYDSLFGDPDNDEKGVLRNDSIFFVPQACNPDALINDVQAPGSVTSGDQFTVSFDLTNYGFCHWSPTTAVLRLVSKPVWAIKQQQLDLDIYPAQTYTFWLLLTAPALKGSANSVTYDNYWRMQISKKYFGPQMGSAITVVR